MWLIGTVARSQNNKCGTKTVFILDNVGQPVPMRGTVGSLKCMQAAGFNYTNDAFILQM